MADWVKIALKTGLVLGVMTALWAVFNVIQIPSINFSDITSTMSFGLAFLTYWIPVFPIVWNISLVMFGVLLALWSFRFATIAVRWLFKVNE